MYLSFSFVQTSFRELVGVLGYEETLPWPRRCNELHSTICSVLLSEFVSQNTWLQHTDNIERVATSLVSLQEQEQLEFLAEVFLQNRRGLHLLTAEKAGLCLFLNEQCCLYVNQLGIVRDMAQQIRELIMKSREELANSWVNLNNIWNWTMWLLPLTGTLFMSFHEGPFLWPLYSQRYYPVHHLSNGIHKVTNINSSI